MDRVLNVLAVGVGGFLGSVLRYLVALWANARGWTSYPWGTWIVNVVGCFLIALILTIGTRVVLPANLRLFLTTGIMGGLTTYSTFNFETTQFFQVDAPVRAIVNIVVTLVACFLAGLLGIVVAKLLVAE